MRSIFLALFVTLALCIFKFTINYISSRVDEKIFFNKKEKLLILILHIAIIDIFLRKYDISIFFFYCYFISIYLLITAFIDFKTQYVYNFLNVIMGVISITYVIYSYMINGTFSMGIYSVLITIAISVLLSILKVWNWGDTEIFIVISPIIARYSILYIYINFSISIILLGSISIIKGLIKLIKSPKNSSKDLLESFTKPTRKAFAPYIAISSVITILIS